MGTIILFFINSMFVESKYNVVGGEQALLELDIEKKIAMLSFMQDTNLIVKKTAERLAHNICKSGFLLESGERIGTGYILQIKAENS